MEELLKELEEEDPEFKADMEEEEPGFTEEEENEDSDFMRAMKENDPELARDEAGREAPESFETDEVTSDREEEAKLRSDDKSTFGEGSYEFISRFTDAVDQDAALRENEHMKDILEAAENYNRLMESGYCPDGFPDEMIMSELTGQATDQVIAACDELLENEELAEDSPVARQVRRLKTSVSEERDVIEDHIYAYLAKHPTEKESEGVETDPSKALETRAGDETGVNTDTASGTKQKNEAHLGDGRTSETMSFKDIVLSVEGGMAGRLLQRDADAYRRSVDVVKRIKGNRVLEQQRFFEVAKELGVGSTVPLSMNTEGSRAFAERGGNEFIDYRTLTENQRMDEIDFSEDAIRQLTLVKSLGFLLGIADWQKIVDPEELLYEHDQREVISIKIKEMQGAVNTEGKISRQEAERFVKQFDQRMDANALKDLAANFGNQMMLRSLAGVLGVDANILYSRMETLFFCIKAYIRTGSINTVPGRYFA